MCWWLLQAKPSFSQGTVERTTREFKMRPIGLGNFPEFSSLAASRSDADEADLPDSPDPQPDVLATASEASDLGVVPSLSDRPLAPSRSLDLVRVERFSPRVAEFTLGATLAPSSSAAADAEAQSPWGETLAEKNADFGKVSINGMDVAALWDGVRRAIPPSVDLSAREVPILDPSSASYRTGERYNWSGLLAQSLLFNVVENTFRAASDDQIRDLLAKKPFWHDYLASTKQFNMRRWNDGDDFLVNYVGHSMHGAVSGFIEIQNDPVGREAQIGANRQYWKSRLKAFLWEVAYSTHSEIAPLGEAGIGNEGGWTYPIRCKTPCTNWDPAKMHSTNNTGWVDFIVTPVVGTLWVIAEDTLDRFISDRVQGGNRSSLGPAFLRGALNPSRTMANLMRFKEPWYRDSQHDPELERSFVVHAQPSEEQLAELGPMRRFSVAPYFAAMPVGNAAHPCKICFGGPGIGLGMDIAVNRWLSASFTAQKQAGLLAKGATTEGETVSFSYGVRFVHEGLGGSLSLAVRPGVVLEEAQGPVRFDAARNTYAAPTDNTVHSAVTVMLSSDFKVNKVMGVRYSIGDTIVRYRDARRDPPGIGEEPYLSWMSKDNYTNRSNWIAETGPVFRF